jgi:hypothetical protein
MGILTLVLYLQYKDYMHGKMIIEFSKKFDDAADIVSSHLVMYACMCACMHVYIHVLYVNGNLIQQEV